MADDLFVPKSLPEIYDKPDEARFKSLREAFKAKFGSDPSFVVRAPGRVNIIGEHVDYCGFPVLPMAIQQDIVVAGGQGNARQLNIANVNPDYDSYSVRVNDVAVREVKWYSYVLAGFLGIAERVNTYCPGLNLMVDGAVPVSAGLSSSSALVCASALATALAFNLRDLNRAEIAELCARAERHVGTQGGGMDQAISFLGVRDLAQLINFNPLKCKAVQLPRGVGFVVANTLVNKWKADGTDFNNRVADCRLGCRVLARKLGLEWGGIATYHQLTQEKAMTPADLVAAVKEHLHEEPYSEQEVRDVLGCDAQELKVIIGKSNNTEFHLYRRGLHVSEEAARVALFHEMCSASNPDIEHLGRLINSSHYSLRDLYDVSIEELDRLTQLCRDVGALGSRLVGAGFGGCTISMVKRGTEESFMKEVYAGYYQEKGLEYEDVAGTALFSTSAASGAGVVAITKDA